MQILKFSAEWCAPCGIMSSILAKHGITSYKEIDIDLEDNAALVSKYKVRSIPTLIKIDQDGNILDFKTGGMAESTLLDFFDAS